MENGPFIDDFPIETSIYEGFSMAMLNNQMVFDSMCMLSLCALLPVKKIGDAIVVSGVHPRQNYVFGWSAWRRDLGQFL